MVIRVPFCQAPFPVRSHGRFLTLVGVVASQLLASRTPTSVHDSELVASPRGLYIPWTYSAFLMSAMLAVNTFTPPPFHLLAVSHPAAETSLAEDILSVSLAKVF
jgi:hypothetical protein